MGHARCLLALRAGELILLVLAVCSSLGCYAAELRRHAADLIDRRNRVAAQETKAILDLIAPVQKDAAQPVNAPASVGTPSDGGDTGTQVPANEVHRIPVDISHMGLQEVDVLLQNVYRHAMETKDHLEKQDDWIRPLKKDFGPVPEKDKLEFGREDWDKSVEYSGFAGSEAYRRGWWGRLKEGAVTFIKDTTISILTKWLPWGLGIFVALSLLGNGWQWLKGRFWKLAAFGFEHKVERLKSTVDPDAFNREMSREDDDWINGHVQKVHQVRKVARAGGKAPKVEATAGLQQKPTSTAEPVPAPTAPPVQVKYGRRP